MPDSPRPRRVIEINEHVVGPPAPRLKTVRPRKLSDYPHLPEVYRDVARGLSSPLRMGPPICDELIAFVQHLFTEEEAAVARHLGLYTGRTAVELARAEHRPVEQIEPILHRLCNEKRVIVSSEKKGISPINRNGPEAGTDAQRWSSHKLDLSPSSRRYRMLPIVPGIFEMALFSHTPESLTEWHHRFIVLFEALYETGFSLDYQEHTTPFVRYLPVGKVIDAHPMALPTDKLEVVLDEFEVFGVGSANAGWPCRRSAKAVANRWAIAW